MAVYVDDMYKYKMGQFGRMKMSHMCADTLEELIDMAKAIGVNERWLQKPPKASHTHFDIALSKRNLAVLKGAKQVTMREYAKLECTNLKILPNTKSNVNEKAT